MKQLYMVEMWPDIAVLLRFLNGQGLTTQGNDEDLGYGVHAWLAAAFGQLAPKPWRLLYDRHRPARILGYSYSSAQELQQYMCEFADPGVCAVCPPNAIASRMMPTLASGRKLAFDLKCCPVGRKAGSGIEKDVFLIHADAAGEGVISRDTVYCNWAKERLQREQAASVTSIKLTGFRLLRQTRKCQSDKHSSQRAISYLTRPQAHICGELTVIDPSAFAGLLSHGIGRHRSFGYGMLLLRPPA